MHSSILLTNAILALASVPLVLGAPSVHKTRESQTVDPAAVSNMKCLDPLVKIDKHDEDVAILSICGGIQGTIEKCGGSPTSTIGQSGTAKFELQASTAGATIDISKGRWEGCQRAARAKCPTGSMSGTCSGGANVGNVDFSLRNP